MFMIMIITVFSEFSRIISRILLINANENSKICLMAHFSIVSQSLNNFVSMNSTNNITNDLNLNFM